MSQRARLNADGFFQALLKVPPPRCLDLLRVAAGVHVVDRLVKRRKGKDNEEGNRRLHLTFEVRDAAFWRREEVSQLLAQILSFLTDDDWLIEFDAERGSAHQDFLDLPRFQPRHAALFSEGLDSAAGLSNRLLEGEDGFILVTVGHQSGLHHRVCRQVRALTELVYASTGKRVELLHSTLSTSLERGKAKRMRMQEQSQRTRAFLFCSAAAVAAKAYRLEKVEMFENGVGSINLPLMTGMLSAGLSTRGAHPTFLRLMSELSSLIVDGPMQFALPFELRTKAEVVASVTSLFGITDWLQQTRSCVHSAVRQTGKTHCGTCPGCIERRQAFAAAGIPEDVERYQNDIFHSVPVDVNEADYFGLYRYQAQQWLEHSESSRRRMDNHLRLTGVATESVPSIQALQTRHCREVRRVFP